MFLDSDIECVLEKLPERRVTSLGWPLGVNATIRASKTRGVMSWTGSLEQGVIDTAARRMCLSGAIAHRSSAMLKLFVQCGDLVAHPRYDDISVTAYLVNLESDPVDSSEPPNSGSSAEWKHEACRDTEAVEVKAITPFCGHLVNGLANAELAFHWPSVNHFAVGHFHVSMGCEMLRNTLETLVRQDALAQHLSIPRTDILACLAVKARIRSYWLRCWDSYSRCCRVAQSACVTGLMAMPSVIRRL